MTRAVLPFVGLLIVWWAAHEIWDPPPTKLVGPGAVGGEFVELIVEGTLPASVATSLWRLAIGLAIGAAIGIPIGLLLGLDRDFSLAAEPTLRVLNAISGIAWLPMMITWLGFTQRTITTVIVYTVVFPMIFNTMLAVRVVPNVFADAARLMGASRRERFLHVYLPGSFPGMMSGFRVATAFGWRALIAGEFVVGTGGLGALIFQARTVGLIERVMLGMVVLAALSLLVDRLILRSVEDHVVRRWGLVQ